MKQKLTDKQKAALWSQHHNANFRASSALEGYQIEPLDLTAQEARERLENLPTDLKIRDAEALQQAELKLSALRAATIELGARNLGLPHLRALHRTLFQDVYHWAGELREVDIRLDDTPFCHFEYIEKEGNALMAALEAENGLADLSEDQFIARMAHYYCEINVLHPFRDGNGRAQRLFFEQLALHAGYLTDWQPIGHDQWLQANRDGVSGDLQGLSDIFRKVLSRVA